MKRIAVLILALATLAGAQARFGHGAASNGVKVTGDTSAVNKALGKMYFFTGDSALYAGMGTYLEQIPILDSVLVAIADSNLWVLDDADTVRTKLSRDLKVPGLLVTGPSKFESDVTVRGSMTLDTTPVTKVTTDSLAALVGIRNEGGLRQKGASTFGATATTATIATSGKITSPDTIASTLGLRTDGTSRLKGEVTMGATATPVTVSAAGKVTATDTVVSVNGIRSEGGMRVKSASQFAATATPTVITAAGNVGIGTTAPTASLEVVGSTTDVLIAAKQEQAELITNQVDRDFSGAGNWTGTGWSISGETFLHASGTTAATLANANLTGSSIVSTYPYELTFTVSGMTTGTLTPKLGTYTATAIAANGTYTIVVNASANNVDLTFTPTTAFDGALDNISLKLVQTATYAQGGILYHNGIQSVGGNTRGVGAVDLQTYRTAATQVASGTYSTTGGQSCTASGMNSVAFGGGTTASGNYSTALGNYTIASGVTSCATNWLSTASGMNSVASGYYSVADKYGEKAHASGRFAAAGDAQYCLFVLRDTTQSSQSDTLKLDGSEAATTGYLTISANQALYFEGEVIAWVVTGTQDNKGAACKVEGMITRDGSNNTTLVWSNVTDKYEHADLAAALSVTLSANDTKESLNIICAGMYEQTIRWVCTLRAVQVGG